MGFTIKAAIAISAAAAVYGIARLRNTSQQAAQAINGVNASAKQTGAAATGVGNLVKGLTSLRHMAQGGVKGAIFGQNQTPLIQRVFGNPKPGTMNNMQQNIKLATSGVNTLVGAAREARHWIKLLFGSHDNKATGSVRSLGNAVAKVGRNARTAATELHNVGSIAAGALGALAGTALLGGSSNLVERSFDLARAREDAEVTFDTLLGSKDLTKQLLTGIYQYAAATPFQTEDIRDASKRLLTISGKSVEENERLYKLAAQIAALKPGTSVDDVAQGLVSATTGEFEILKGMTFKLNAAMFGKAGASQGKDYAKNVIGEIEKQLANKTGGRDLVAALGGTMTGLMSTVKDSLDIPLGDIGSALIQGLDIKNALSGYIKNASDFAAALKSALAGDLVGPQVSPGVRALVDFVVDIVKNLIWVGKTAKSVLMGVWTWFSSLDRETQGTLLKVGGIVGTFSTIAAIVAPIIAALVAMGSALSAPISAIAGAGPVVAAFITGTALPALAILGAGFMVFRRNGESAGDTLSRMAAVIKGYVIYAWTALTTVLSNAWIPIKQSLLPAWEALQRGFDVIRPTITEIIGYLYGGGASADEFAAAGRMLGQAIGGLIITMGWLIEKGLVLANWILKDLRPVFKYFIGDVKTLWKTLFGLANGTVSVGTAMKTFILGIMDFYSFKIRFVIFKVLVWVRAAVSALADIVMPINEMVGNAIKGAADGVQGAADRIMEGFLSTKDELFKETAGALSVDVKGGIMAETTTPVTLNLDGETIAKSQATTQMRSRHSGRGGDPMSPEDLGFVIQNGRIRSAGLAEAGGF